MDADLPRADRLGGESEDSFESGTLRSDLISTVNGVFALSLPKNGWISSTRRNDAVLPRWIWTCSPALSCCSHLALLANRNEVGILPGQC